jgi:hypothetical protein
VRYQQVRMINPGDMKMTTNESTSKIEAAYDVTIEPLSLEKLDQVVGGINPQPLPPRDPDPRGLNAQ